MMHKSAPRRDMFPKEFLIDLNATKAAERCGYSKKCARNAGARLMANANIQEKIQALQQERSDRLEITADMWLRELWIIGNSDIKNYMTIDDGGFIVAKTFDEMPKDSSRALEAIEENRTVRESADGKESNIINSKIKFKLHSKLEALKLIGQYLGFLKEKVEHSGEIKVPIRLIYENANTDTGKS